VAAVSGYGPRWVRITLISLGAAMLSLSLVIGAVIWRITTIPAGPKTAVFQYVAAIKPGGGKVIEFGSEAEVPLFLVDDGRLYLKVQVTQARHGLYMEVDVPHWDVEMLAALIARHPEIRSLLPDPGSPTGGIKWIALEPALRAAAAQAAATHAPANRDLALRQDRCHPRPGWTARQSDSRPRCCPIRAHPRAACDGCFPC
jgi:hypothetical protein